MTRALSSLVLVLAAAACERVADPPAVPAAQIAVSPAVTLRTDTIGVERFARTATFALVEAQNLAAVEAEVTLGGVLVDADGHEVGPLRPESLRIPPGARRMFALIDRGQAARPTATTARIDVRHAREPRFPAQVVVTDRHIYDDGGRAVITGYIENLADRPCVAMVMVGFVDGDGRPMTRPFAAFDLGAKAKRPARFVGPPGARTATLYIGDVTYCPPSGCNLKKVAPALW